jgi:hypothetical protein
MITEHLFDKFQMKNIRRNKICLWLCCLLLISYAGGTDEQEREREALEQIDKIIEWELNKKDKATQKDEVLVALYLDTEEIGDSTKTAEYRCYSLSSGGRCGYSGIKTVPFGAPWSTWERIQSNGFKKEIVIDPGPPYKNFTKVVNLVPGEVTNLGYIVLEKVEAEGVVSISGTIKDENGEPLEGVEVSSPKGVAVTDSQGRYRIDGFGLDVYDLTAVKNGYISASIKVSIRDMDNSVIEKDFVLSLPRKIRLRYVISPKDINDFNSPEATAGTAAFSVDKTFLPFPVEQIESSDFRQFINQVRMDVRLANGKLTLSDSYAPIFYERLRSAYVDFEAIRGVENLDYNAQHCPPIEQGDIILIDGGKTSDYVVKILFEEIQPVLP